MRDKVNMKMWNWAPRPRMGAIPTYIGTSSQPCTLGRWTTLILLSACLLAPPARAATRPAPASAPATQPAGGADEAAPWGPAVDGLQTRLSVNPLQTPAGEFVEAYLDVRNVSAEPIDVAWVGHLGRAAIVERLTPQGPVRPPAKDKRPIDRSDASYVLQPGLQANAWYVRLDLDFDLAIPGTYRIRWGQVPKDKYTSRGRVPPSSNVATVRITPAGAVPRPVQWLDGHAWSKSDSGLQTRLTAPARRFGAGRPIPIRLELHNAGKEAQRYYAATGIVNGGVSAAVLGGKELPFLGDPTSTTSHGPTIEPGQSAIVDEFDVSDYYYMRKPGKYLLRYEGEKAFTDHLAALPPSGLFQIEVVPDPAGQADGDPVGELLAVLPRGWMMWGSPNAARGPWGLLNQPGQNFSRVPCQAVRLVHESFRLKAPPGQRGAEPVTVWLAARRARPEPWQPPDHPDAYDEPTQYLGSSRHYHVHIHVPQDAQKRWLSVRADVRKALGLSVGAPPDAATQPAGPAPAPDAAALARLWDDLGSPGAPGWPGRLLWKLNESPADAASFLLGKLRAGPADAESIKRLIADLDSDTSWARQSAFEELSRMDKAAEDALREAMKGKPSAEARHRMELLMDACAKPLFHTPATRRMVRAVWALEAAGHPEARRVLERLAKGDARWRTTHLAGAALARLDGRPDRADPYQPRLRYEVKPHATRIELDGSVILDARLVNDGIVPAAVYWGDYAYEDTYRFAVRRQDGTAVHAPRDRFTPPLPVLKAKYFPEIAPGESVSYQMFLAAGGGANCQTHYFRRPGKHTIRASFAATVRAASDADTGQSRPIPGAWTGVLTAEPVTVTVAGDAKVLAEGVGVSGRVVDTAGKPIADARVTVRKRVQGGGAFESPQAHMDVAVEHTFTDAQGRFSFLRLPDDSAAFTATAAHPLHPAASVTIVAAPPRKRYEVRIVLAEGVTARGVVVGSDGRPVAGVRVDRAERCAYTDAGGRFVLHGLPDEDPVALSLWKPGFFYRDASAPRRQATDGTWTIALLHERGLTFRGRAVFADGKPAALLMLEFRLRGPGARAVHAEAQTDSDGEFTGRFTSAPSQIGPFSGLVEAAEPAGEEGHEPRRLWHTTVENIVPGRKGVELVLENRGVILALIQPANALPASVKFRVTCELHRPEHGRHAVARAMLDSPGGRTTFDGLTPGIYWVHAQVTTAEHWQWTRQVTLGPKPQDRAAQVEFVLPALRFGGARAMVLAPDGKTLVPEGSAWFDSSASWGSAPIRDGVVELKEVPVGAIHLEIRGIPDMARKSVTGVIREGKTTDLGRVVLQRLDDVTGWVQGRVLYDDGTPALGAGLVGESFDKTPVKADGSFRARLPAGEGLLVVDLAGAAGWPAAGEGRLAPAPVHTTNEKILVPVQVQPGKAVTQDIILPRKTLGKLSVDWKAKGRNDLAILVSVQLRDCRLVRTLLLPNTAPGTITVESVPAGAKVIGLNAAGLGYQGCKEVPPGEKAVTFDAGVVGSMAVRAVGLDGKPAGGARLSLRSAAVAWLKPVCGLNTSWMPISWTGVASVPGEAGTQQEQQDGTVVFPNLCPGRYIVAADPRGQFEPKLVEVQAGKRTVVVLAAPKPDADAKTRRAAE